MAADGGWRGRCTPMKVPAGASAIEGLLLACGHHRNGVLMASATGRSPTWPAIDPQGSGRLDGAIRWDRWFA